MVEKTWISKSGIRLVKPSYYVRKFPGYRSKKSERLEDFDAKDKSDFPQEWIDEVYQLLSPTKRN